MASESAPSAAVDEDFTLNEAADFLDHSAGLMEQPGFGKVDWPETAKSIRHIAQRLRTSAPEPVAWERWSHWQGTAEPCMEGLTADRRLMEVHERQGKTCPDGERHWTVPLYRAPIPHPGDSHGEGT